MGRAPQHRHQSQSIRCLRHRTPKRLVLPPAPHAQPRPLPKPVVRCASVIRSRGGVRLEPQPPRRGQGGSRRPLFWFGFGGLSESTGSFGAFRVRATPGGTVTEAGGNGGKCRDLRCGRHTRGRAAIRLRALQDSPQRPSSAKRPPAANRQPPPTANHFSILLPWCCALPMR